MSVSLSLTHSISYGSDGIKEEDIKRIGLNAREQLTPAYN